MSRAKVTFQLEPWSQYYPECQGLWKEHWEEFHPVHLGKMPMAPAVSEYEAMAAMGQLQVMVARSAGKMVGYCLVVVRPHLHYCHTLTGFEDSYFLTKPFRKGLNGLLLLKHSIEALRARGVQVAYFMTKEFNTIERLFLRLGGVRMDSVWMFRIGKIWGPSASEGG